MVNFNGKYPGSERIPNTCNVSFIGKPFAGDYTVHGNEAGVECIPLPSPSLSPSLPLSQGDRVLGQLKHSQASVGAACHSHSSSKASPVLLACGVPEVVAVNALRLSVGRETTKKDVDRVIQDLKAAINTLRA